VDELCKNFWKDTEFRQLSLLFVRDVRKAPNRGLEGSLLPLTRRSSGNYLGFPTIPENVGEIFGEKYSIWFKVQRNLQNQKIFICLK